MESSVMDSLVELHFDLGYFSLIMYLDERPSSGSISMMFHFCISTYAFHTWTFCFYGYHTLIFRRSSSSPLGPIMQ